MVAHATHFVSREGREFRAIALGLQHVILTASSQIRVGDQLVMRELAEAPDRYDSVHTLLWLCRRVTHVMGRSECAGIESGWRVLSLNTPAENEWATVVIKRELELARSRGKDLDECFRELEQRESLRQRLVARQGRSAEPEALLDGLRLS